MRTLKYLMMQRILGCVMAKKIFNKKVSSTWKMEDTDYSTSLSEISSYFIMVISGIQ